MQTTIKATATTIMWILMLAFLYFAMIEIQAWVVPLAFVLMIPLIVATVFTWSGGSFMQPDSWRELAELENNNQDEEKRKRERLDAVLRDLSDEQLQALRLRLQEIDDDALEYALGEDGELIGIRRKSE